MADVDEDGGDLVPIPVTVEFYLKGRDDPYQVQHDVGIFPQFVADADVSSIMSFIVGHIDDILNTRDAVRYQFKTSTGGAQIVLTDEIQAISICPITDETIQRATEQYHAD